MISNILARLFSFVSHFAKYLFSSKFNLNISLILKTKYIYIDIYIFSRQKTKPKVQDINGIFQGFGETWDPPSLKNEDKTLKCCL